MYSKPCERATKFQSGCTSVSTGKHKKRIVDIWEGMFTFD